MRTLSFRVLKRNEYRVRECAEWYVKIAASAIDNPIAVNSVLSNSHICSVSLHYDHTFTGLESWVWGFRYATCVAVNGYSLALYVRIGFTIRQYHAGGNNVVGIASGYCKV